MGQDTAALLTVAIFTPVGLALLIVASRGPRIDDQPPAHVREAMPVRRPSRPLHDPTAETLHVERIIVPAPTTPQAAHVRPYLAAHQEAPRDVSGAAAAPRIFRGDRRLSSPSAGSYSMPNK